MKIYIATAAAALMLGAALTPAFADDQPSQATAPKTTSQRRGRIADHRESYFDIVMVAIVSAIIALATVIILGTIFGSF